MNNHYRNWLNGNEQDWNLDPINFYEDLYLKHFDKIYENNVQRSRYQI
jgi:hypothetical protein